MFVTGFFSFHGGAFTTFLLLYHFLHYTHSLQVTSLLTWDGQPLMDLVVDSPGKMVCTLNIMTGKKNTGGRGGRGTGRVPSAAWCCGQAKQHACCTMDL